MPNVLVFESDAAFAGELKGELEQRGCAVTVVDDASVGLQAAASHKPDLILLTIELPRMNGFSVCNKLKRDTALKEVPLIIMSSDSTEETFEQHRRLRTHAEEYVHKPIAFGDLLPRIAPYVRLGESGAAPTGDDDIIIDEDIDFEETQESPIPGGVPTEDVSPVSNQAVDAEVDAFTESAFGSMIESPSTPEPVADHEPAPMTEEVRSADFDPQSIPAQPVSAEPAAYMPAPAPGASLEEMAALKGELDAKSAQLGELDRLLAEARARSSELEETARRAADQDAELSRISRELEETKQKLATAATSAASATASVAPSPGGTKGGASAREFLDLREALNKKDKELLDLRDQITHREKELLGLRDANLGLEREKADSSDRIAEFEKQAMDGARQLESARADKEQAAKRADDFKRKSEKVGAELDARNAELADTKQKLGEETSNREVREAALQTAHSEALARAEEIREAAVLAAEDRGRKEAERVGLAAMAAAEEERERILTEARDRAARELETALAAREAELKREHDEKLSALYRANEDAMNRLKAEHAQLVVDAEKAEKDHGDRQASLIAGHETAMATKTRELEAALEAANREHEEAMAVRANDHAMILAARDKDLERTHSELADTRTALEKLTAEKADSEGKRDARIVGLEKELVERERDLQAAKAVVEQREAKLLGASADLAAARNEVSDARAAHAAAENRFQRAIAKWTEDRTSLERAKDALAAALAQIDEIEARPIE